MWHINYKIVDELRKVFPAEYQGQLFFAYVPRKNAYEVQYFFLYNNVGMRCDAEVNAEVFSTEYYYNWTDADITAFINHIAFQVNAGLEEFESDEDDT